MRYKRAAILLICIFGFVNAFANTAPYFTAAVEDTNLTEDVYWSVWLSAADDDGDPYTFDFSGDAPDGMTINTSSGRITWTPDNDDVGTHRIEVSVSDGSLTDYMNFFLHVHNLNDPPYWVNTTADTVTVAEDSELDITVTANDDDLPHGDHITYTISRGENVTVNSSTGSISGSPDNSNVGYQTVTVRALDDSSAAVEWSFVLETSNTAVVFTNTPPTEINEDDYFEFDLSSNDEGQGNTVYYFQSGFQPEWLGLNAATGVISGTPGNEYVGAETVKIIVDDDNGSTDTLSYDLTVVNRKPVITTSTLHSATEDEYFSLDINADDEGAGSTVYQFLDDLEVHPAWLSLNTNNGVVFGTPSNTHVGSNSFYLEFDDGNGGKDTTQFVINVVNDPVRIDTTNLVYDISEDQEYYYKFTSNDDGQGSISYHGIGLPDWLTINLGTGVLRGTPNNENVDDYHISVYVSDGTDADTVNYTIHVENRVPQQESADITSVNEDSDYYYDIDFDDEGEGQVYEWNIKPSWLSLDTNTGELTGSPDNSNVGDTTVSVRVNDGNGGLVVNTFNLSVINRNPVFSPRADTTITQDTDFGIHLSTDDDNDPEVVYSWVNGPPESSLSSGGNISWTPDNSMIGVHSFEIRATDNHGGSSTLAFTVTVTNLDPVITSSPSTTVEENSNYIYDVQSNEEGIGDVTYSLTTAPGWLSIVESTGYIEGVPGNSDVGTHNVTVRVDDGNSGYVTQSWTITVTNLAPTITNDVLDTATEDSAYSYQITTYPADEGDLTFSLVGDHPDWISINALSGVLSGTPANSDVTQVVRDSITVRVADEHGGSDEKKFELIINNSLPVFTTTGNITVVEDEALNWDINANDEGDEGPNASGYNLVTAPDWMTINSSTGVLGGTPRDDDVGTSAVSIRYQDGNSGVVALNVNVIVSNDPPAITSLSPTTTATEDAAYSFQFTSDDDDRGFAVYSSRYDLPADLTLSTDGLLSGTPNNSVVGNQSVGIIVTDKNGGKDTLVYTLTIANAESPITAWSVTESPYTQTVDTVYVTEDLPYAIDFTAPDEEDGSSALYTVNHKPDWMTVTSLTQGQLEGTPDNRHVGRDYVDITFSDGNGYSNTKRVYIQVQNVISSFLDPPASITATEDAAFTLDLNSSDEGQGTITYSITAGDPGWITLNSTTGAISGTPDNDDVTAGVDVTFQVTDGNGGTATKTIVFIVENTNDDPTWSSAPVSGSTVTTAEDALYSVDIDAADVDVGDNITYSLTEKPTGMTINTSTGVISWTPDNSQVGSHSVTVQVSDDYGSAITRSWTVQVNNTASPISALHASDFIPTEAVGASADTFFIKEDTTYSLNLSAPDEETGEADEVLYDFGGFSNPDWVVLNNAVTGVISLTPTNNDVGLDSFKVFFKDQPGSRDTATVYLYVQNVVPAILTEGPFAAVENEKFIDTLRSSDDGDGTVTWSFVSGKPSWMNIEAATGKIYGTPGNDDVISDAGFTVQVNDGNGGVTQKSFDYSVENVNTGPSITVVPSGIVTTDEDVLYTTDVDATDSDAGDVLIYSLPTAPTGMTINSTTGVIQWTPANDDVGTHTVTVKVADSAGEYVTSSWQVRVNNLNDAPTWVSVPGGTIDTDEDEEYSVTVEADDIDSGDNITYSLVTAPGDMTIDPASGKISWTPDNDDVGLHDITVKATDDSVSAITAGWTLNVLNVNDAPAWSSVPAGTVTSAEDAVYTVDVDATDVDAGDVITYSLTEKPTGMTINSSTGVISWTPDNSAVGNNTVTVKATDLSGGSVSQSYTLQITNVASAISAPVAGDFSPSAAVAATADTFYIKEDTTYTLNLSAPDENVGASSAYSFDDFANPDWITLANATTGIVSLTPTNGDVGLDSFLVYFQDQPGSRDTITVYLRVENVAPEILTEGPFAATEGTAFSRQLTSSDDDDGTVIWSFVSGKPDWLAIDSNTGLLSGTPADADVVSDGVFTVKVDDGNSGIAQKEYTYSVTNVNNSPVWTSVPGGTVSVDEDSPYSVTISAADPDLDNGDVVIYSLVNPPLGMTINGSTGQISWTPDNSHVGSNSITVKATDTENISITSNYILNVLNIAPVISAPNTGDFEPTGTVTASADTFFVWEDSSYTVNFSADDEGLGDAAVYRTGSLSNPDWVTLTNGAAGIFQLQPINKDVGLDSIRVVFDDGNATDTALVYIRVQNNPPRMIAAGPFSATEDEAFDVDLESTDEDASSNYSFVGDYPAWMSLNAATGLITGTPTNDAVGTSTFTVRVADGHGGTDDQLYTINVANTNDPPIISSSAPTTATEDVLFLYDLEATDQDGDPISYRLVTFPEGMTIDTSSGLIRWTPDNNYGGGTVSVKASVEDTTGFSVEQVWEIAIANAAPNFLTADAAFNATEDTEFSVDLDVDDEGQGLTNYAVIHLPGWLSLTNSSTGLISGTPDNSYVNSSDSVYIEFSDGNGGKDTLNVPVNVANAAPVFTTQTDTLVNEAEAVAIDLNCDDETAGGVSYNAQSPLPDWLTLNSTTGELTGTPDNSDIGAHRISIRATDAAGGFASITFLITVQNVAPTFTGTPLNTIAEDSLYEYTLTIDDDSGANTFQILTNPGWLTINGSSGKLSGTALNNHVGDNSVSVRVEDGHGAADTLDFVITVTNSVSEFITAPVTAGQEDIQYSLDLNSSDEGQGTMIYTALRMPEWLSLNATDGLLRGTPLNQHVTAGDTVEIQVNDGNGGFDTLKYALAIANKGPDFTSIFTDTTITEDDVFAFDIDSDDEGQGDTEYSFTNAIPDWIALDSATGVISGTPLNNNVENFIGLNIKVDDGNGGVKTRTITLSVSNNPARFTSTISDSVATEDELFSYDADTDDEAQGAGVYSFSGLPAWLSADDTTGILSGTPTNDDVDTAAVTIQFNDGNGSIVEQLIHVIVENANDIPVLTTTTVADTIDEDVFWSFQFSAVDIDSAYGDTLSFELLEFPTMMQVDSGAGLVFWTPQNADVGDATFELWVFDRERASDSLKFRLHINNTNDAPVLTAQADTIAKEDELFIYKIRFEDVDAGDSARFELITGPPLMEIDTIGGILSWTPTNDDRDRNFTVIYSVRDGLGETDVDTFDLFVMNINDPPVLEPLDDYEFAEDSSLTLMFSDWFDKVDDIDNLDTTLNWQVFAFQTANAVISGDTLTISGPLNWHGPDTGKVVVSDGELTDTTKLAIFVTPVNDPPVIDVSFPALISFTEDETTTVNLNDYVADVDNSDIEMNWSVFPVDSKKSNADINPSDSDLPAEFLVKSLQISPNRAALVSSNGDSITIVIDPVTNIATFYAQPDFYLDGYDFMFVVDDSTVSGDFGRDSVTTTIQVVPANDPPVLADLPELSAAEDSTITVLLSDWFEFVNDVDNHDTTLTWNILDGNFTTAVIADSLLLITPQVNRFGDDTLRLIATDAELLADTADVVVHFQSVNDPPVFSPLADITIPEDDTLLIDLNDYVEDVETADEDLIFSVRRESGSGRVLSNIPVAVAFESSVKKDFLFVSEKKFFSQEYTSAGEAAGEDSIQITIDEVSHIASICGTLNYHTDFQLFTFYVSDGDAVDSVNVNIAIESVNDKPALDSLPAIAFQEDSVFVLALSQWDSLVYDVEDSDDTLRWSFAIDGSVFLNYDTTNNQITLFGAEDFNGSSALTAIVTDLDGLSDTALVNVEILPVNDPPQIDSSLFAISFDQKDTVEYGLDAYVSDTDHDNESLVWQFIADDLVYFNYTDTARSVRFWTDPDKFGIDSVLAIVTDPLGGSDSQYVVITVTDTTRPSFELAIFQNQLASRYVEIDVFPSELLGADAIIITDGDTLAVQRALDADSVICYNATYQIEKSGIVRIYVGGVDRAGNNGDLAYEIGVSKISRETGGALTDPDSIMSFLFAADAVPMDLCALFIPYKSEIRPDTGLAKGLFAGNDFPVSDEFDFRIPVTKLDDNARIMFSLDRMQFLQQYATELGIYILEDDDWQYLTTYTSREKGSYWAYSAKPGLYQIRVNSANPAVVLPEQISVMQNYPNPFNSQTTIRYTIGAGSFVTFDEAFAELIPYDVSIKVYNILGQEVATLVNRPQLPGFYSVTWNGRNKAGKTISTGLYIYQVIIGDKVFHKKMTILK